MSRINCACSRYPNELHSVWYISLLLNSLAITTSHVIGVTIYTELRDDNDTAAGIAITTGVVLFVSIVVYVFIYGVSGYVPMGRISEGLRIRAAP